MNRSGFDKRQEEQLIKETMRSSIDMGKATRIFLAQRLRHPFIRGKVGELEPNVFFGYSDHPLDINATAQTIPFTFLGKNWGRSASCVLQVGSVHRQGNSFQFLARGYNIIQIRNMDTLACHEYLVNKKTRFQSLTLQIDFLREDAYRLRLAPGADVPANQTPMLYQDITDPNVEVEFIEDDEKYKLTTPKLSLHIYKMKFRIEIFDAQGRLVTESGSQTKNEFASALDAYPLGFIRDRLSRRTYGVDSFILYPGEAVYGLGEHFRPVNRVGQTIGLWNFEGQGNTSGRVYKNIPFFMSTQGYGVFVNESRPVTFWIGSRELCRNQFAVEGELIDYYFFYGPSFKTILDTYTELTGKPPLPPRWSFGTWVSRISYFSQDQVSSVMQTLREMKFPADVIHIDSGWFKEDWVCDWRFDEKRFPDPRSMFNQAHELGFRISLWQIPYILRETGLYQEARKKGLLAKNNGPFVFLIQFLARPIDFSKPEAVEWYQGLLARLLEMGADAIKTDFGEQIEPPMRFMTGDGRKMHNLYALLYQKAAFEITRKVKGKENAVIWARSAYAGAQRFPVHWSGDNSANHENLLCSLRGGLSLGLCGFSFWSQDTGGFVGMPADDVYIRWVQLSIFQSHIRFHGHPPKCREPWNFSLETQKVVRDFLNLRYRLIPYIFSEAKRAADSGLPLLRHLVLEYQNDPTVRNIEDEFLCGRNLLIAPILTRNDCRQVYLPEGMWYDFWSGEKLNGNNWISASVPLDKIPIYVKEGTILPLGPIVQCTDEIDYQDLTLKIYPDGAGNAHFDLFDGASENKFTATIEGNDILLSFDTEPARMEVEFLGDARGKRLIKKPGIG